MLLYFVKDFFRIKWDDHIVDFFLKFVYILYYVDGYPFICRAIPASMGWSFLDHSEWSFWYVLEFSLQEFYCVFYINTHEEKCFLTPESHRLPIKQALRSLSSLHVGKLAGLILVTSCVGNHNFCEAKAMSCPADSFHSTPPTLLILYLPSLPRCSLYLLTDIRLSSHMFSILSPY